MRKYLFYSLALFSFLALSAILKGETQSTILNSLTLDEAKKNHSSFACEQFLKFKCNKSNFKKLRKHKQPNILFFLVDELRAPPEYESDELKEWKRKNLVFQTLLAEKGTVFHNHYCNTNACVPSRAVIHTGQYPNVTGVTQTEGAAKPPTDPQMTWLKKFRVPTIGNYLREHGYQTYLKGKWHVADSSIKLGDGSYLTTFTALGIPIPELYRFYLEKNVLNDYGYDGWIGPEPVGTSPLNSGDTATPPAIARDVKFNQQIINQLDEFAKKGSLCKPWFLIASYVNPHDITTFGIETESHLAPGFDYKVDPTLPENLFKPEFQLSFNQTFDGRPPVQKSYHDLYPQVFQPIPDNQIDRYQRFYYTLQKKVDEELLAVWNKLMSDRSLYENTIIVFTSDHGDLLSSHGRMFQKWYQAFQEAIHVPLIISSPLFGNKHQDVYSLTSHIDLLPTFLRFANANPEVLRQKLGDKFRLNLPLSGHSLTPLIAHPNKAKNLPVFFYTEDNPTQGTQQFSDSCQPYDSVVQPSSVEAILAFMTDDLWKLTNYYTGNPGGCGVVPGPTNEMFNITQDPMELNNLFGDPAYTNVQRYLFDLLVGASERYRATGSSNPAYLE